MSKYEAWPENDLEHVSGTLFWHQGELEGRG